MEIRKETAVKWISFAGVVFLLWGCGARKTTLRERERTASSLSEKSVSQVQGEKLVVKDTVILVRAPLENSRNTGEDSSWLQTSLAWSLAVWKEGKLWHEIGNLSMVPAASRTVYRDRWLYRQDTLVICDTVRERVTERLETVKGASVWQKWWGGVGKVLIVVIAGYIAWHKLKAK